MEEQVDIAQPTTKKSLRQKLTTDLFEFPSVFFGSRNIICSRWFRWWCSVCF